MVVGTTCSIRGCPRSKAIGQVTPLGLGSAHLLIKKWGPQPQTEVVCYCHSRHLRFVLFLLVLASRLRQVAERVQEVNAPRRMLPPPPPTLLGLPPSQCPLLKVVVPKLAQGVQLMSLQLLVRVHLLCLKWKLIPISHGGEMTGVIAE